MMSCARLEVSKVAPDVGQRGVGRPQQRAPLPLREQSTFNTQVQATEIGAISHDIQGSCESRAERCSILHTGDG
jgi:hypothetical protein